MKVPLLFFIILCLVMTGLMAGRSFAEPVSCVQYFYGEGCPHCAQINQYLEDLKLKYPKIQIQKFEIYENRTNALILTDYFSKYSVQSSELVVPIVFIGDKYLAGSKDIESLLEDELNKQPNVICGSVTTGEDVVSKEEEYTKISLFTLVGAALVDSINPCAIAVLLILLSALIVTGGKKRALRAGLAFTTSIYISYLLFGLGLVSALKITGLSFWFHQFAGVFAILVGILNLKDYFWYGWGGFVIEIPRQWRPSVKKMLEKVTTPIGAFSIGFVVSLFELPCTGGPYIFILGLLAEKVTETAAIPLLLFYNVFFILPLIVITFLVYKGFTTVEKTTTWKERNIRILHLVAGIVMIVLGIIVVFDFI